MEDGIGAVMCRKGTVNLVAFQRQGAGESTNLLSMPHPQAFLMCCDVLCIVFTERVLSKNERCCIPLRIFVEDLYQDLTW